MQSTYIGKSKEMQELIVSLEIARKTATPSILWGDPGIGKTELVKTLAYRENLRRNNIDPDDAQAVERVAHAKLPDRFPLHILIGSTMDPQDVDGLPAIFNVEINGKKTPMTRNTLQSWAYDFMRTNGGILFLDELNSASERVLAAELSLLQGRRIGQHKLPDSVWIIAAANSTDIAVNGFSLPKPLSNRLLHFDMVVNDDDYIKGFMQAWGRPLSDEEKELRIIIAGYLDSHRDLIQDKKIAEKSAEEGSKAWYSRRSWDNAAKNAALAPNKSIQHKLIQASVGAEAAAGFRNYRSLLKLPSYTTIMNDPEGYDWGNAEVSVIWLILQNIIDRIQHDNIQQSVHVFELVCNVNRVDWVAPFLIDLIEKIRTVIKEGENLNTYLDPLLLNKKLVNIFSAAQLE